MAASGAVSFILPIAPVKKEVVMEITSPDRAAVVVAKSKMPPDEEMVMLKEVDVMTKEVVMDLVEVEAAHKEPASEFAAATEASEASITLEGAVAAPMPPRRSTLCESRPPRTCA